LSAMTNPTARERAARFLGVATAFGLILAGCFESPATAVGPCTLQVGVRSATVCELSSRRTRFV
jgi:hypothetical protein